MIIVILFQVLRRAWQASDEIDDGIAHQFGVPMHNNG